MKSKAVKPYQKVIGQFGIAILISVFIYMSGLNGGEVLIPFTFKTIDIGWLIIPFVIVVFIAVTNSVNLTDGVDGLAGSVSVVYLLFLVVLITVQVSVLGNIRFENIEYENLKILSLCLVGAILGFLVFNYIRFL